jgi:hypothetical protein
MNGQILANQLKTNPGSLPKRALPALSPGAPEEQTAAAHNALRKKQSFESEPALLGAGNRIRTGDPQLGKLMLYQLSYSRQATRQRGRS